LDLPSLAILSHLPLARRFQLRVIVVVGLLSILPDSPQDAWADRPISTSTREISRVVRFEASWLGTIAGQVRFFSGRCCLVSGSSGGNLVFERIA
jgi:hypothetical protein